MGFINQLIRLSPVIALCCSLRLFASEEDCKNILPTLGLEQKAVRADSKAGSSEEHFRNYWESLFQSYGLRNEGWGEFTEILISKHLVEPPFKYLLAFSPNRTEAVIGLCGWMILYTEFNLKLSPDKRFQTDIADWQNLSPAAVIHLVREIIEKLMAVNLPETGSSKLLK
jgi:hypothetical protein